MVKMGSPFHTLSNPVMHSVEQLLASLRFVEATSGARKPAERHLLTWCCSTRPGRTRSGVWPGYLTRQFRLMSCSTSAASRFSMAVTAPARSLWFCS